MGLVRRHMKIQHGINITAAPSTQGGAKRNGEQNVLMKCDRCSFKAKTKEELLKHLDANHTNKQERCNICQMVADDKVQLMNHMKSHNSQNVFGTTRDNYSNNYRNQNMNALNQPGQNQKTVCRFWVRGNCSRGGECRFDHPRVQISPVMCRDGDYCLFWPQCKFTHVETRMCHYQDRCFRQNCQFIHENPGFLEDGSRFPAPNIQSYQEFPQLPEQMWRPW